MLTKLFPAALYLSSGLYGGLIIFVAFSRNGMKVAGFLIDHKGWGKNHRSKSSGKGGATKNIRGKKNEVFY